MVYLLPPGFKFPKRSYRHPIGPCTALLLSAALKKYLSKLSYVVYACILRPELCCVFSVKLSIISFVLSQQIASVLTDVATWLLVMRQG